MRVSHVPSGDPLCGLMIDFIDAILPILIIGAGSEEMALALVILILLI